MSQEQVVQFINALEVLLLVGQKFEALRATTADGAYKTMKPVFRTSFDAASGMSTVDVQQIVTAGEAPTKRYDPANPLADKDGNVFDAAVDESRELVDMIKAGTDVNTRFTEGRTALYWAVCNNREAAIQLLLKERADPNLADTRVARVAPAHTWQ